MFLERWKHIVLIKVGIIDIENLCLVVHCSTRIEAYVMQKKGQYDVPFYSREFLLKECEAFSNIVIVKSLEEE